MNIYPVNCRLAGQEGYPRPPHIDIGPRRRGFLIDVVTAAIATVQPQTKAAV